MLICCILEETRRLRELLSIEMDKDMMSDIIFTDCIMTVLIAIL